MFQLLALLFGYGIKMVTVAQQHCTTAFMPLANWMKATFQWQSFLENQQHCIKTPLLIFWHFTCRSCFPATGALHALTVPLPNRQLVNSLRISSNFLSWFVLMVIHKSVLSILLSQNRFHTQHYPNTTNLNTFAQLLQLEKPSHLAYITQPLWDLTKAELFKRTIIHHWIAALKCKINPQQFCGMTKIKIVLPHAKECQLNLSRAEFLNISEI